MKRDNKGRFSTRRYYKLPEEKIKPVLMYYYALIGILASAYIIGCAFCASFNELKQILNESKTIIIINERGGADDRIDAISGETEPVSGEVSGDTIEDKIRRAFGEEAETALAVAKAESSLNPSAVGDEHLSKPSIGLFQISQIYHDYSTDELMDIDRNIEIAKDIFEKGGWSRWTTYRTGAYLVFK